MNTPRRHHAVAIVLSLFITLTIFSGVTSLAGPDHGAAVLAQVATTPQT